MEEKILSRVRKMLKLANDAAATEGERDNAMRMVHATMAKYNLDMAQVEASGGAAAPDEERIKHFAEFYGRPWARRIAYSMAKMLFCTYIYTGNSDAKLIKHHFIGRKSNAITAQEMAEYLIKSVQREARAAARIHPEAQFGRSSWERDFCKAAATAIYLRVDKIISDASNQKSDVKLSTGTSLVLRNLYETEASANAIVVQQSFGRLGKGTAGRGTSNSSAVGAGTSFGNSVSLNKQVGGGGSTKRLT